jgi:hypothetical protein
MHRQLHGCQSLQFHQSESLDLLIETDPFRRSEKPLAAPSQMLHETVANIRVNLSEGPGVDTQIQSSSSSRSGAGSTPRESEAAYDAETPAQLLQKVLKFGRSRK